MIRTDLRVPLGRVIRYFRLGFSFICPLTRHDAQGALIASYVKICYVKEKQLFQSFSLKHQFKRFKVDHRSGKQTPTIQFDVINTLRLET